MHEMNDIELILILAFYYIGKERNIEKFTALFNSYFCENLSAQTILYEVSCFRNVNPANNVIGTSNTSDYQRIWAEYISDDRIEELKELYKDFLSQRFIDAVGFNTRKEQKEINSEFSYEIKDEPKSLSISDEKIVEGASRNHSVIDRALFAAGYKCEGECNSELFVRRDGKSNYTEGHHLIPLCFQTIFDFSLDVEANVVSLCPRCHSLLHYGRDKDQLLKLLYQKRIARLKACKIGLSYERLLLYYAGFESIKEVE